MAMLGLLGCTKGPPTGDAELLAPPTRVFALGRLEPLGGVISISGTPGDRLMALDGDVRVGAPAPANGLLGVMASFDLRRAQLDALLAKRSLAKRKHETDTLLADANLQGASASVAQAEAKQRDVAGQEAKLDNLREAAAIAAEDYRRLDELATRDADMVTPHELRRQRNLADRAMIDADAAAEGFRAALAAAESACAAARASLEAAEANRRQLAEVDPIEALDKEIKVAKLAMAQSLIWSPDAKPSELELAEVNWRAGDPAGPLTVLEVFLSPGEMISQLPVLQLGDLSEIHCTAEVYEADAASIYDGQPVRVVSPAFDGVLAEGVPGKVTRVSGVISSPGLASRNPLAPVDRSVVEVEVRLEPESEEARVQLSRRIGLQVTVEFTLDADNDAGTPPRSR